MHSYQPHTDWVKADKLAKERRTRRAMSVLTEVYQVLQDLVHIGNMGELPPSPKTVWLKARQLDLLTESENETLFWEYA